MVFLPVGPLAASVIGAKKWDLIVHMSLLYRTTPMRICVSVLKVGIQDTWSLVIYSDQVWSLYILLNVPVKESLLTQNFTKAHWLSVLWITDLQRYLLAGIWD